MCYLRRIATDRLLDDNGIYYDVLRAENASKFSGSPTKSETVSGLSVRICGCFRGYRDMYRRLFPEQIS